MKNIQIEFLPGDKVWILTNNVPVETQIRAYRAAGSLEVITDETGKKTESLNESVVYSTFARPNDSYSAQKIGKTKENLIQKLFGRIESAGQPGQKEIS